MMANENSLPHAVIFEGDNRLADAEFFAKSAVCSGEDKPCDNCKNCLKADKGVHPDIIKLQPSGAMKNYPIEEIRRIKEDAFIMPNEAAVKVYIFNDTDNISVVSQNALLKILEEPPKGVIFILTCESKAHLLDTIISRATVFRSEETKKINETIDLSEAFDIVKCAISDTELELLIKLTALSTDREKRINTIVNIQSALQILYKTKICGISNEYEKTANLLTLNKILNAIDITENVRVSLLKNKNVKLTLTKYCANLKSALGR